jgi:hypothetical protein
MQQHPNRATGSNRGGLMYWNCPHCGLTIRPKANRPTMEHCPRCIARGRRLVRMFASTLPARELYASADKPDPDRLIPLPDSRAAADAAVSH